METRIEKITESSLAEAQRILRGGGVVAFPTETVYGLAADARRDDAVRLIYAVKGRPSDNPLIVHVHRDFDLSSLVIDDMPYAKKLRDAFLPGPLTLVYKSRGTVSSVVSCGLDTLAVRVPSHEGAQAFLKYVDMPLAAPSANLSKHVSPVSAEHVYADLHGRIPLILDGGECGVGIESTVLDLTSGSPVILRPGAVTAEMLAPYLGVAPGSGKVIGTAKSPGMKYEHYAPTAEAYAALSAESAAAFYDRCAAEGRRPVLLFRDIHADVLGERERISLGVSVEDFMHSVYSALRAAEKDHDVIVVETLTGEGRAASVMNRVMKAVGGKTV